MGATLLIRHSGVSWNEWVKARPGDHIILDPLDSAHGVAGRLALIRDGRPAMLRFYGSLDPQRSPHVILAALHDFLKASTDPYIHCPVYRPNPVLRHTLQLIAGMARPSSIVVASGVEISLEGWPVGPGIIELPAAFPEMVASAQRKAQWLALIEKTHLHEVPLDSLTIEGARIGSGTVLHDKAGIPDAIHVEVCGPTLLVLCEHELEDADVARALDLSHASRATVVSPREYENLVCALVRESGEEIGHGMIERFDFPAGIVRIWADAVPPVPVRVLKLGSLRVDRNGKEFGEVKAWAI